MAATATPIAWSRPATPTSSSRAGLQAYDIVALIPIIEGAGGRVTDWQGGSAAGGGRIVATGDPRLHDLVLERLALV